MQAENKKFSETAKLQLDKAALKKLKEEWEQNAEFAISELTESDAKRLAFESEAEDLKRKLKIEAEKRKKVETERDALNEENGHLQELKVCIIELVPILAKRKE